jgi:hypothetical protein
MSLYNIQSDTTFNDPKATWDTNNSRESIRVSPPHTSPLSNSSNLLANDRYVVQSKILSSNRTTQTNQNVTTTSLNILPITTSEVSRAIRGGFYNKFTNLFNINHPFTSTYYVPKQNIASIYNNQSSQFKNNTKISGRNYDLFLPENYQDVFNSKSTILNPIQNTELSSQLNTTVLTTECYSPECSNILATFVQPLFDTDSETYNDISNFGISFNNKDVYITSENLFPIILNIKKLDETIVSIVYGQEYINTQIAIKHPLIPINFSTILPINNSEISI